MASSEFGTGKSIVVLAIVVGCFAILWPKIFYPMMQAAFSMTAPTTDGEDRSFRPRDRPPHLTPDRMPHLHEGGQVEKSFIKEGRPFPHPSSRQPVKPQAKTGGAMSIIMPIYTIGIVVFFLYTVLKLVFKKSPEVDKKPMIKDFHMDPDYHKFVCQNTHKAKEKPVSKAKVKVSDPPKEKKPVVTDDKNEDYEIYKLRKKLEETESAMERIMKHMGAVSECLSNACLLKDCSAAGFGNKNIALETLLPESLTEVFKKTLSSENEDKKVGKSKKPDIEEAGDVKKSANAVNVDANLASSQECPDQDCHKNCNTSENSLQKDLKRDSSINSETSSFELLGHISNDTKADTDNSDSEHDESESDNNEISEKSTCSEAMDDVLDDDENCAESEECQLPDDVKGPIEESQPKQSEKEAKSTQKH